MPRALISGISGQDGSYLAELLLARGYDVFGLIRRTSSDGNDRLWRVQHILNKIHLIHGDLTDQTSLMHALHEAQPDEIYNLAAQSFVKYSFQAPVYTADVTGLGALKLFDAARLVCPKARIFHASSSEMFGDTPVCPQSETTAFKPRSPYGIAKVFAHQAAINYRESYGLFISCGISFNHESPRRGLEFVTRKITDAASRIKAGLQDKLHLGNLDAKRDWSYAPEIMEAAWMMLQHDRPDDFVLASGETHTVREFLDLVFEKLELDPEDYVVIDEVHMRPVDVPLLQGDATKAKNTLGWTTKTTFHELADLMTEADAERVLALIKE